MRSRTMTTCIFLTTTLLLAGCAAPPEDDESLTGDIETLVPSVETADERPAMVLAAPGNIISMFDNEYVTLMRVYLKPGQDISEHQAPRPRLVYALSDASLQVTVNGETTTQQLAAGQACSWDAGRYAIVSSGESDTELLVLERMATPLPERAVVPADAKAGPEPAAGTQSVLAATPDADVIAVTLGALEELPLPRVLPRLIYSHSDAVMGIPNSPKEPVSLRKGGVHWHEAEGCTIENLRTGSVRLAVFTLLR